MQKLLKDRTSPRTFRLFLLAGALAGAALVSLPPRAEAIKICPFGTYPGTITIYYTDASHSTVVCSDDECTGVYCDTPTPYSRTLNTCCSAN